MTESMIETPMIAAATADGYQQALQALVTRAQAFLGDEDADSRPLYRHARKLSDELRAHDYRPRQRMTRTEVHRNALRRLIEAIDEFVDLEHHDGGALGLDVWEAFQRQVKSAARAADSYGPGDTTWAPEDETNPPRTTPVPDPDPAAEPINGVRQGDYVTAEWFDEPRRVLTGVVEGPLGQKSVRLSDPRDGGWFGGYFVPADEIGTRYALVDAEARTAAS